MEAASCRFSDAARRCVYKVTRRDAATTIPCGATPHLRERKDQHYGPRNCNETRRQRRGGRATRNSVTYTPRFDIVETEGELLLYGDLPGVSKDHLAIDFENGNLSIEGKVTPRHTERDFVYGEYGIGDFRRSFTISEAINAEKISAELRNGVLTLHLPKSEAAKPRKIAVKGA